MRPTLFLLHGLRGSHQGLNAIAKKLESKWNIINLDLPGSGTAPALEPSGLNAYIEYLHEAITKHNNPTIIAHSMGATIASHYVTKYPDDTTDKLVLISPVFRTKSRARRDKTLYLTLKAALSPLPKNTKKKLLASRPVSYAISHFLTSDKSQQKYIDEQHYAYSGRFASAKSLLSDVKLSMSSTTILPRGKHILVITGTHDKLTNLNLTRTRTSAHPSCKFCEVKDTGHLVNYERPDHAAKLIAEFLEN